MHYNVCKWLLLVVVVALQVGCASESVEDTASTPTMEAAPNPSPGHDDSHGWGANIGGVH